MSRRVLLVTLGAAVLVATWLWLEPSDAPAPAPPPVAEAPRPAPPAPAPPAPPPGPVLKDAVQKIVRRNGQETPFTERRYDPPYVLPERSGPPDPSELRTPEDLAASYYASMVKGDWEWWKSLFDAKSWSYRLKVGVPKERFLEGWKHEYAHARFEVSRRIDIPGYAILYIHKVGQKDDDAPPHALRIDEQGRWWMSFDLQDNPVYAYDSMRDDVTVRVVGR